MGIEQSQTIDLFGDAVFAFIQDATVTTYDEPDPPGPVGYSKHSEYEMAVSPLPIRFSWAVRETYTVTSRGQYVSSFDVIVPLTQKLKVTTISVLFVRNGVDANITRAIRERLESYDPSSGIDPNDWARDAIPAGVTGGFALFDVRQRARLEKLGSIDEDPSGRQAILDYFVRYYIEAYQIGGPMTQVLRELPATPPDMHVREVSNPQDPTEAENAIDDIVSHTSNCEGLDKWQKPVADLVSYPEFKIQWELVEVTIGCFRVKLHLPVLYVRNATQQLWVFGRWPHDPLGVLERIVKECAEFAAGAAIVVGLVLANFVAALKAFEALFVECIKQKLNDTVECVTPGLAVLVRHDNWRTL